MAVACSHKVGSLQARIAADKAAADHQHEVNHHMTVAATHALAARMDHGGNAVGEPGAFLEARASLRLGRTLAESQRSKKAPCSKPGCGQYDEISQEHQYAAQNVKNDVMAETA